MKTKKTLLSWAAVLLAGSGMLAQTNINTPTINQYYPVTAVGTNDVAVSGNPQLQRCDKVLIIQMKGVNINTSNTASYGNITTVGNAGNYEFAIVGGISGGVVTFMSPLVNTYNPGGLVQLVTVPVYNTASVNAPLSCVPWNGQVGGVLVFEATCGLTLKADIDVSGKGFRGGALNTNGTNTTYDFDFVDVSTSLYASGKGEGIYLNTATLANGRGPNATGGGGGNNVNGGGAGGSNCGAGGTGGDVYTNAGIPANTPEAVGGLGGNGLSSIIASNKIFLGSGGGAGHQNDNVGTAGGNGGGIVIIKALTINGSGFNIVSNGNSVPVTTIDGQGGGGAGGSILLDVPAGGITGCAISAQGGNGGSDTYSGNACHGKGGGGGGGLVWTNAGVSANVSGGQAGQFVTPGCHCYLMGGFGATNGVDGCIKDGLKMTNPNNCNQIVCQKGKTTGINSLEANTLDAQVFPNPSNGQITISGLQANENISIRVTDITGRVIVDKTVSAANGSYQLDLPADQATYFMEVKNSSNQVLRKKLMIAK